ncbi:MAG: 3-methyladenine DNA glycosylase [Gemmataceae bacterium]
MTVCIAADTWRERRAAHAERLRPFADAHLERSFRHEKHPALDFLFEYYSFRPAQLLRWTPGIDVVLEGATPTDVDWPHLFEPAAGGMVLRARRFSPQRRQFLRWAVGYLEAIANRPPHFACWGLHEWAMVYRTVDIRHTTPLRLVPAEIDATVDSLGPCCTHFDAFRFFTPAAVPLNRHTLDRRTTDRFDQPGCIHVVMDLYKYAYKVAPFAAAELTADAFALAIDARTIDMRASPYDLRNYGLVPIRIETTDGRAEYAETQRELVGRAAPLRARLLDAYRQLLAGCGG